jgi:hypothetical protein
MARQRDPGISAHVHGQVKAVPAGLNVWIGQIFFFGKGAGVDHNVQPAPGLFDSSKNLLDFFVFSHITRQDNLGANALG